MIKFFQNKVFLFAAAVIMIGGFFIVNPAFAATVASQVDQYTQTGNDGVFTRSLTAGNGSTVSQTTNQDGSVVVNINNAIGYADSGFYTKPMNLKDVKSVTVTGSGSFGVNIWLDTNPSNDSSTNGEFFTWNSNGNVFVSYGGDESVFGPSDASHFDGTIGGVYGSYTLADLKAKYPNTDIAFWVGTTIVSGGGSQSATITAFNVEKPGSLAPSTFGVMNLGEVIGYSGEFNLTDATIKDATSIVMQLYSGATLLQTNTATAKLATVYPNSPIFSAPFDVMGTFNYVTDGYWTNVRETQYGQTLAPTKVVATVTLANGKVVTAESTNPPTGDPTIISNAGTLAAQDFGVWNSSGVNGYSTGLKLTDATFTGATVVVKLYSGNTLLQTNTATTTGFAGLTQISSPFDVLGSFDYPADGYWTNGREAEYGKNLVPTRVEATATLANGKVVTAENTNLTGDTTTIVPPGSLATAEFGVMNFSNVIGYSTGFVASNDADTSSYQSMVVKLYSGDTLLQTDTAVASKFAGIKSFSAPFDVNGTFNYTSDGYWANVRGTEYGKNLIPTRVVATVTLGNGKVLEATNTTLTGDTTLVVLPGSLATQDFGVWKSGEVNGYSAGFKLTDATFTGATVVVKLYSGDTLLQTNTATTTGFAGLTQISSPFDVFGTFDYTADGYWTNVRASEYGQTMIPTSVVATVTLSNGKEVTVTNENLTGDPIILESIAITTPASKLSYTVGDVLDITGLVVTGTYSNTSTSTLSVIPANVTGFNSSVPATGQVLTITIGGKTATYTVNIIAATQNNGGGNGGGGGSVIRAVPAKVETPDGCETGAKFSTTTGRNCNAATPALPSSVTPKVLGEKVYADSQLEQIFADALAVWSENRETILVNAKAVRNDNAEKNTSDKYLAGLVHNEKNFLPADANRLNWFITYGTVGTKILGAGERAGVINSYKAAFGKLPKTEAEWQDAIKIANGRWPSARSEAALTKAKITFKAIYGREADMNNAKDNAAVTVMAYGLRPSLRNLNSEKAAILAFKYFIKRAPVSAIDWDTVRAIAYSGAKR